MYTEDFENMAYNRGKSNEAIINDTCIHLKNYDISSICNGHLAYRKNLNKILEFIDFEFWKLWNLFT